MTPGWSIEPQYKTIKKERIEVPVKFCHTLLDDSGPEPNFISLKAINGWVAVHLCYVCANGEKEIYKVHRSMRTGNYSFHVPDTIQEVRFRGRAINVLDPRVKRVKHAPDHGMSRLGIMSKIIDYTKRRDFAEMIVAMIDGVYDDVRAKIEKAKEKIMMKRAIELASERQRVEMEQVMLNAIREANKETAVRNLLGVANDET